MLLFILNFQNEKKMGFSDTRTMEGDNDPNGIIHHSIKKKNYHIFFLPFSFFFFFPLSIFIK